MEVRVVITGLGVIAPNGIGVKAFERAIRDGRSGISFQPQLEALGFRCHVAGVPPNSEALGADKFTENQLLTMNSSIRFGCLAALEAWENAGLSLPDSGTDEINWHAGALIGAGAGNLDSISESIKMVDNDKVRRLGSRCVEKGMISSISAKIGGLLALGNRVSTLSSACSSGLEAIIEAASRIKQKKARIMLAGGSEGISPYIWAGFDALRVMSYRFNDAPEHASRPMSAAAAGFVPGAGSGIMILEELEHALERNARIYAEYLGGSVNSGGQRRGGSITAPNKEGVINCIKGAISAASIEGSQVDAINGHLTATFADPLEVKNWQQGLNINTEDFPMINSTKSLIGHTLGAAGGLETIASILQIYGGFVHGSVNCMDLHPDLAPFSQSIVHHTQNANINILAKANFGFGDVNSCAIFKKWIN